jgi:Bacteroidetes-specific putative membrane protein
MKRYQILKINILFTCLITSAVQLLAQQNIQFTQYMFNALSVNPAYAGYKEEWFIQATHRLQWTGLQGAPVTSQLSVDGVTNEDTRNVGLGLQLATDKLGAQTATSLYADYAYRLRLDDEDTRRLSLGLGVGITQYGLDGSMLSPVTDGDQTLTDATLTNYIPDVRVGVYYSGQKWYLGFSAMDLFSGDNSNKLFNWRQDTTQNIMRKRHFYLITGGLFNLSEYTRFRPGILWKEDLKGPSVVDLNSMFIFGNRFWLGASYRTGVSLWRKKYNENQALTMLNSVSGIVQFIVSDNLRVGYSYDVTLNGIGNYQRGTHEFTLGYTFKGRSQRVLSPRFF